MVTGRILDIPPYNTYALTCTASSRVQSIPTAISKTIQWSVSFNSGAFTTVTDGVMTSNLTMATSSSVLSVTASVSGEYVYRCGSQLELVGVDDSVEGDYSSDITIYGRHTHTHYCPLHTHTHYRPLHTHTHYRPLHRPHSTHHTHVTDYTQYRPSVGQLPVDGDDCCL